MATTAPLSLSAVLSIVAQNALAHFRLRVASWAMAIVNLSIGVVLTVNPDALTENPGASVYFARLISIAPEEVWRAIFLIIGVSRLLALIVNGTFPRFTHSPHIRATMSAVSAVVWTQMAGSVINSGILSIGTVLYTAPVLLELYNTGAAASETKLRPDGHFG